MPGWLEQHLQTFVKPYLGFVPPASPLKYFSPEEMSVIKSCWRSLKAAASGKTILLPGRDVFVFEILAQREGYPTIFLPECSRASVSAIQVPNKENMFLFDTGFVGSIPVSLGIKTFKLLSCTRAFDISGVQIFPRLTLSRGLALKIEKTPKYWQTGRLAEGKVIQEFSYVTEFLNAAELTIEVYKNSAPKFVAKPKPIGGGRYGIAI